MEQPPKDAEHIVGGLIVLPKAKGHEALGIRGRELEGIDDATPHHAWERGTCENTNGLIRQYVPTGTSMAPLTQSACERIAEMLNTRPRKRLAYRTAQEWFDV